MSPKAECAHIYGHPTSSADFPLLPDGCGPPLGILPKIPTYKTFGSKSCMHIGMDKITALSCYFSIHLILFYFSLWLHCDCFSTLLNFGVAE